MTDTLANRLKHLFATIRKPDGAPYTPVEVAEGISRTQHVRISKSYLYSLLNGGETNPSLERIAAIATFFDVPLEYFSDSEEGQRFRERLDALVAMKRHDVQQVLLRAGNLPEEQLAPVLAMLEYLDNNTPRDAGQ